jgi:tRNA pseudouridine(55) synthase
MSHGVLVIDKPLGPTSHDVVQLVRRAFGTRAVGHAGTLDPMATGVLVVGLGEATKLLHYLSGVDKVYLATITLGTQTDSLDAQGCVVETRPLPADLSFATVSRVAAGFLGEQLQRVPDISAIKQAGQPLYQRARRGEVVEAPERQVRVHALDVLRVEEATIELRVHCGKGFYVRSLARDLAAALGSVGHLSALRRVASGAFSLADAVDAARLSDAVDASRSNRPVSSGVAQGRPALMPPAAALRGCRCVALTAQGVIEVGHGRAVLPAHLRDAALPPPGQEPIGLLDEEGALRALGRAEPDRIVVIRGLHVAT